MEITGHYNRYTEKVNTNYRNNQDSQLKINIVKRKK